LPGPARLRTAIRKIYQYTVSFVSGSSFSGNHGNPVTGFADLNGNPLTMWGSNEAALQGFFDLSGIPLPPGATRQLSSHFRACESRLHLSNSVGPTSTAHSPSGTLASISVPNMSAAMRSRSPSTLKTPPPAAMTTPSELKAHRECSPPSGLWSGRLSQVGQTDCSPSPFAAGTQFTVVTEALDETGAPTNAKAMPSLGVWTHSRHLAQRPWASSRIGRPVTGESWLQVSASADDVVRLGVADERGDGPSGLRLRGWVLYADTVSPSRLPSSGGPSLSTAWVFGSRISCWSAVRRPWSPASRPMKLRPSRLPSPAESPVGRRRGGRPAHLLRATVISGGISYGLRPRATRSPLMSASEPTGTVPIGVPEAFFRHRFGSEPSPRRGGLRHL